jgi:HAD superfamily hydrolase (TIGR01490 family)
MAIALFDLDHTLLDGCSTHTWNLFVGEDILGGDKEHLAMACALHDNDKGGQSVFTIEQYDAFTMKIYPQYTVAEMAALVDRFVRTRIEQIIFPRAREVVEEHRRRGDLTVMITATNRALAEPISRLFAMDDLICTVPEVIDGRYTGRVDGRPCYREGKLDHLDRWLTSNLYDLTDAWFYSDSRNDLPLLKRVDHPVAVDPDAVLLDYAKKNIWRVLSFKG